MAHVETLTVTDAPTPLDLLLYRRFRAGYADLVEATLDANPGLAALGPALPIGTEVTVTVPDRPAPAAGGKTISLWD